MGADESAGGVALPEYDVGQHYPDQPEFDGLDRQEFVDEYGRVRAFFKLRPHQHRELQRWLNQARMGTTYDIYLTESVTYALAAVAVGLALGIAIAWYLSAVGFLASVSSPVRGTGSVFEFFAANKVALGAAATVLVVALVLGAGVFLARYYFPALVVSQRRSSIDFMLPHAITYMYALSYGGMNLVEVVERLAESEDAYGEVAREMETVQRDVTLFGNDLMTAFGNARNLTPSENLERFLDDLVSVLDAGGDVTLFFESQAVEYYEAAKEEQEDFLETLSIFSEVFISAFIATPLFLIVILMVISFLGGSTLAEMVVLIYVGFPLGMGGFLFLVHVLSAAYAFPATTLDEEADSPRDTVDESVLEGDERFEAYAETQRTLSYRGFLADPLSAIRRQPLLSLVVSVPAAVVFLAAVLVTGAATPSIDAFTSAPVETTSRLVVYPLLVVIVPLSLFYELKRARELTINHRFPDTLNILASANNMGIPFTDALEMVSRWSSGVLADELSHLRNDIEWHHDMNGALLAFANRLRIPDLSRSLKLIADGARSTGDLSRILNIAADSTRDRFRLDRDRRRAMSSYIAVVVIGYLVYLLVIYLLSTSYLAPIAKFAGTTPVDARGLPISFRNVPVNTYRMLFFHSVLIQGVGSGLLAGKLADNTVMSGLKYAVALVAVALVAFTFI